MHARKEKSSETPAHSRHLVVTRHLLTFKLLIIERSAKAHIEPEGEGLGLLLAPAALFEERAEAVVLNSFSPFCLAQCSYAA
jgi:hypothetical protein